MKYAILAMIASASLAATQGELEIGPDREEKMRFLQQELSEEELEQATQTLGAMLGSCFVFWTIFICCCIGICCGWKCM